MSPEIVKSDEEWRQQLTPEQFAVLRQGGTERAFTGKYVDCHDDGTFRCAGCGAELFLSQSKYDSGCGWPSFTEPADNEKVRLLEDRSHGMLRTEVRCAACDGHLGHVFDDGPRDRGGLRYCINSLSIELDPDATTTDAG
jgi:peptide-methionine (R)-S-oxide reductase